MAVKSRLTLTSTCAVVAALALAYFVSRGPEAESLRKSEVESQAAAETEAADLVAPTGSKVRESAAPLQDADEGVSEEAEFEPFFRPEFTLSVRDAHTLIHLEDVELVAMAPALMMVGTIPGTNGYEPLGGGLDSPIPITGVQEANDPDHGLAGFVFEREREGETEPVFMGYRFYTHRFLMYARAPGYSWNTTVVDFSQEGEAEILLTAGAALSVRVENLQLERYDELKTRSLLYISKRRPDNGWSNVRFQKLDEELETEGQLFEGLHAGEYHVSVELGETYSFRRRVALAKESFFLEVGETREVVFHLDDPPLPSARAPMAGVVSFPAFEGAEEVQLEIYECVSMSNGGSDVELPMSELKPVGGALPGWSFRVEDLPIGRYQVRLWPFMTAWMVELPPEGMENLELAIPELAEVEVVTVDEQTGEQVPLEEIRVELHKSHPGQVRPPWMWLDHAGEPGRFRFRTAVAQVNISTPRMSSESPYGQRFMDLQLVAGHQTERFELGPVYAIHFDFRDGEEPLLGEGEVYYGVHPKVRALNHGGQVTDDKVAAYRRIEVDSPGRYEITFDGLAEHRFLPIPPQRVDVAAGEPTVVTVHMRRK